MSKHRRSAGLIPLLVDSCHSDSGDNVGRHTSLVVASTTAQAALAGKAIEPAGVTAGSFIAAAVPEVRGNADQSKDPSGDSK